MRARRGVVCASRRRRCRPCAAPSSSCRPHGRRTQELSARYDDESGHYRIKLGDALGFDSRYKMLDHLGEGTFGKVVETFDRRRRTHHAVKIIKAIPKCVEPRAAKGRPLSTGRAAAGTGTPRRLKSGCLTASATCAAPALLPPLAGLMGRC